MNTIFSVVTAVRNDEGNIVQTLKSVTSQHSLEFTIEHILIDGASSDGTVENILKYVKSGKLPNIIYKFVSEADRGIYDAMNKGRKLASGSFLIFLNSGDEFSCSSLLTQIHSYILSKADADLVYYGNVIIRSELCNWRRPQKEPPNYPHKIHRLTDFPHHQSIFYPKVFYEKQEYDIEFIRFGDTEYTMLACSFCSAYYMPIDITSITLGGLSTKAHSIPEAYSIFSDFVKLARKYPKKFNSLSILRKFFNYTIKYLVDKLFGERYKHWLIGVSENIKHFT